MCKLCNSSEEIPKIYWNKLKLITIEFMKISHQYTGQYPCIVCRRSFREQCRKNKENEVDIDRYIQQRMKFFYIQKSRSTKNRRIRDAQRTSDRKYYKRKKNANHQRKR